MARIFPTHKHAKLHHLTTLFDNTNVVSHPEKGNQIARGVFWQTFTKSCHMHFQITNNILEILMPPYWQNSAKFFVKRFTLTMDPILTVLLRLFGQNSKFKSGGPRPNRSPGSATYDYGSLVRSQFCVLCSLVRSQIKLTSTLLLFFKVSAWFKMSDACFVTLYEIRCQYYAGCKVYKFKLLENVSLPVCHVYLKSFNAGNSNKRNG